MAFAPLALLPASALKLLKEVARHLLRRPVIGICAAAHTDDGRWLLIRRADTGTWGLPGGTLEWGETLTTAIARELLEEAGVSDATFERVTGIYSHPDRDPRFHAVTIVVAMRVGGEKQAPDNPLEIREARFFHENDLPKDMAMSTGDMLDAARRGGAVELE